MSEGRTTRDNLKTAHSSLRSQLFGWALTGISPQCSPPASAGRASVSGLHLWSGPEGRPPFSCCSSQHPSQTPAGWKGSGENMLTQTLCALIFQTLLPAVLSREACHISTPQPLLHERFFLRAANLPDVEVQTSLDPQSGPWPKKVKKILRKN